MTLGDLKNVEIDEFLTLLFGVMFGLLILSGIFYAIAVSKRKADDAACPFRKEYVRVVDRGTLPANAIPQWSSVQTVFETKTGERISLSIVATNHFVVGDQGVLKWQGKTFIGFERDVTAQ